MASIRKRGKGYQIDYYDPLGKRIRVTFSKKKEAEAELGKRISLIAENRYLDVKKDYKTTLDDLVSKYRQNYTNTIKAHYCNNYLEYFGKLTLLANIRYVHLETYRNHLRRKPTKSGKLRADATVNREISCLHHMMTKAAEWDMIESNPFSKGKSLMLKENNQRLRYLTDDEIKRLLDECPTYLYRIIMCALHTGMRRGEILSLKWDQIKNNFIYLRKTKTKEPRQIPLNDEIANMLKTIRSENHLKSEYVFTYDGTRVLKINAQYKTTRKAERVYRRVNNIKKAFNAAVRRAGINDFRFHDLRHTFASQVIMRGGSIKDVQELLGHKTMSMTLRYAHLSQEHKRNAVNLLNGLTNRPVEKVRQRQLSKLTTV